MDPAIDQLVKAIKNGAVPHNLESLVVDFKQEKSSFKETAADLAEACVCFANASGGTLILDSVPGCGGLRIGVCSRVVINESC